MAESKGASKHQYWLGVTYPDSMIENWESECSDLIQMPFAYCIHDKDKGGHDGDRKVHVHWILPFKAPTTEKHAFEVLDRLSKPGMHCLPPKLEWPVDIRWAYDYLIHDTDNAKKKGKHQYDQSERVEGNGFDIDRYDTLDKAEKERMAQEVSDWIMATGCTILGEAYRQFVTGDESGYFQVFKANSAMFERLTRSNFQEREYDRRQAEKRVCVICRRPGCAQDDFYVDVDETKHYYCSPECESTLNKLIDEQVKWMIENGESGNVLRDLSAFRENKISR